METGARRGGTMNLLTLGLSATALILSLVTAWWTNFRSVHLEVDSDNEIQVNNALGGKPEANLTLTLWGDGSKGAHINVSGADMDIRRVSDSNVVRLEATGSELPLVLEGQSGHKITLRFTPNLYLPELIDEYERWSRDLRDAIPAAGLRIDSLRTSLVEGALPVRPAGIVRTRSFLFDLLPTQTPRNQINLANAADLLGEVDAIKLRRLVYFVPGQYMVTIRVKGKRSEVVWTNQYIFDIQGAYATSLQRNFSTPLRVPLRL